MDRLMTIKGGWMVNALLALGNGSSGVRFFSSFAGLRSASHRKKVLVVFYSEFFKLFSVFLRCDEMLFLWSLNLSNQGMRAMPIYLKDTRSYLGPTL